MHGTTLETWDSTGDNQNKEDPKILVSCCFFSSGGRHNKLCNLSVFVLYKNKGVLFTASNSLTPPWPLLHNLGVT